jgi:hypothetical protein
MPTVSPQGLPPTSLAGQVTTQVLTQPGVVATPTVYSLGNTQQTIQPAQYVPQPTMPTQQLNAVGLAQAPVTVST